MFKILIQIDMYNFCYSNATPILNQSQIFLSLGVYLIFWVFKFFAMKLYLVISRTSCFAQNSREHWNNWRIFSTFTMEYKTTTNSKLIFVTKIFGPKSPDGASII